ncbi:hypothetical protein [Leptolyngbya sp. FACHB-261]|uniref:hypothetical protein n=1 Tax=Leptolyngbya sp. FACHB-261 TaxID=2692806 RepID=UPI001689D7F0|nr:hypothetical protein [Leptolyngbya sp. FACHB-261]MBD2103267.1 hypothetical protein [Leptolyngbya sp. FACHB-261]
MDHFSPKSLAFYTVAIGSVVVLFNVVTAYGEANLKAPAEMEGRYRLSSNNLPNCLQQPIVLFIQQSGVYLNAGLEAAPTATTPSTNSTSSSEAPLPLSGHLQKGQFWLAGSTSAALTCTPTTALRLEGTSSGNQIQGQLQLGGAETETFSGQKQSSPEVTESH